MFPALEFGIFMANIRKGMLSYRRVLNTSNMGCVFSLLGLSLRSRATFGAAYLLWRSPRRTEWIWEYSSAYLFSV